MQNEKARTLVISDIHGCMKEFKALLKLVRYDANKDMLILLGDYVSRGPDSKQVIDLIMELVVHHGAIALQGNHDHRFVKLIENTATEKETVAFFEKGGVETLASYFQHSNYKSKQHLDEIRHDMKPFAAHISFLKQLPYFYKDEHYLYVHAGLKPGLDLSEQSIHDLLYIKDQFYLYPTSFAKPVIFGHTNTVDIHKSPEIWHGGDKIGIDGGCAFGYQLNCLELINGEVTHMYHVKSGIKD